MPRHVYKRLPVKSDPIYESHEVAKLINYIMRDGKKSIARQVVYFVLNKMKKDGSDPLKVLNQALANVAPVHEVKPRRLGGASYLVPIEVRRDRRLFLALNWVVDAAISRSNKEFKTFGEKLYAELMDAVKGQGSAVAKRQQTEKLAEANKAFAHLKW